eukprot:758485-Hanusia_phi.AAC.8
MFNALLGLPPLHPNMLASALALRMGSWLGMLFVYRLRLRGCACASSIAIKREFLINVLHRLAYLELALNLIVLKWPVSVDPATKIHGIAMRLRLPGLGDDWRSIALQLEVEVCT